MTTAVSDSESTLKLTIGYQRTLIVAKTSLLISLVSFFIHSQSEGQTELNLVRTVPERCVRLRSNGVCTCKINSKPRPY